MSAETEQTCRIDSAGSGALFHGMFAHPDDAEQLVFTLPFPLDVDAYAAAWQALTDRHAILRAGLRGGVNTLAADHCKVDFRAVDWRDELDAVAREEKLESFLDAERAAGFDPSNPPCFRVAVIHWDEQSSRTVWTLRRALLDWRSMSTLLRELFAHYEAIAAGRDAPGATTLLVSGYAGRADAPQRKTDTGFWNEYLAGYSGPNRFELAGSQAFAGDNSALGLSVEHRLDAVESESIRRLRKSADVTLNNIVQAAWAVLLSHYTNSGDVVFGILRSCRHSSPPGYEDAFGSFMNILPLRARVEEDRNAFEMVWQMRDQHRKVRAHEYSDSAVIAQCVMPDDNAPLFDTVLEFDLRDPVVALEEMFDTPDAHGPRDFRHVAGSAHGLHLQVFGEDNIALRLKYPLRMLTPVAAQRLLRHYARLLVSMANEPWTPVRDLDYLDPEDKLPVCWPGASRRRLSGKARNLHGGFEDRVTANPQAIALACGEHTLTYAELNRAANRLAHQLRAQGAAPDTLIGLCAERSVDQIIGMLGILKSGAGYLPLDPSYPPERLAFLVDDAGISTVVAPVASRRKLPATLRFVDAFIEPGTADESNPAAVGTADDLAYVIYTSGSTGQPKGVMVSHRNVVRLFDACESWLHAGIGDVWSLFHSFAFDFSVWEIWGALLHGGRLEIVPRNTARSPEAFYEFIAERGVTVLNQTPSAFRQLIRVDGERPRPLPALRLVIFGGEKLDIGSLREWTDRHGDASPRLINMYGITETTVHVTYRPITCRDAEEASQSLIGWPLPNLYVRLLDSRGRPVPPGVRGEICVGGAGVTRGYLNRPELNAHAFIQDAHSNDPAARLYRSGDFAELMPSGELCYLGREDDQVKIRGFRIDLGEISASLRRVAGIENAVVITHRSRTGDTRLVAYYTAGSAVTEAGLRDALAARLPEHMVPAVFIRLAKIPVNANHKIDFKALPDPADAGSETLRHVDPPETPVERQLAQIWADVLERREIGRSDDFFRLGGDSVLAVQVVAKARAAGLEIAPRDIFENSALCDLASVARAGHTTEFDEEADVNMDGPFALTPIQRWFFEQGFDNPQHFNQAYLFRLPPDTDVDLLERACLEAVGHHDALHMRFAHDARGQWQALSVEPREALEFSRIELDHLDASERREAIMLITDEIQQSLSISSGLLVRVAHFTGGLEDGDRLLIAIHQLAVDVESWGIILHDIDTAYRALAAGREPVLPPPTVSFARWAAQLSRLAESQAVASERAYWEKVVSVKSNVPPVDPDVIGRERDARVHTVVLEAPETSALLGDIHHAYGTEINELLIAGLSRACAEQWPAGKCLRIDVERHGRDHTLGRTDVSRTVGWFTTRHPVSLDQGIARNPGRLICDVKTRLRTAPHKGIGWGLLRYLRPQGPGLLGRAHAGVAPILFSYRGNAERQLSTRIFQHVREDTGQRRAPENRMTYPLAVIAVVHDDRMEFDFRFSPEALGEDAIEALAERFVRALKQLVRHCRTRDGVARTPVDFPLAQLSQEELDRFPVDLENAEDILPLSPIQRLYHALSGTGRDAGFDQWVFRLEGRIDENAFEKAWQDLLHRHDALRTIFVDEGIAQPHQVVLRDVKFRLQRTDWRLLDATAQEQRLAEFLAADRRQGFSLDIAPLTRVTLIRAGDREWILVWSHHMAQVDGWSWPILAAELGESHDARLAGRRPVLTQPGSYRSYVAWLMDRDVAEYAKFWREHLRNSQAARTLVTRSRRRNDGGVAPRDVHHASFELSEALTQAVVQLARDLRLTPSVVFQGAWALLLSALTLRFDVTLGVAFSARTAGIPISEHTVGPFVNDLPVRVRVSPTTRVDHWLADLRAVQADLNHYQNVSPLEVHEWADSPASMRLFDSLIVFQNYATGESAEHWGDNIRVRGFSTGVITNYPLTLAITPGSRYRVDAHYDRNVIDDAAVTALGNDLRSILDFISKSPDVHVATILNHVSVGPAAGEHGAHGPVSMPESGWARRSGDRETAAGAEERQAPLPQRASQLDGRETHGTQATVAEICADVLGIDELDADANFFDAGAQSVSLVEIHERVQKALKRSFPIVKLFQHPTVEAISRYLDSGDGDHGLGDVSRRGAQRRAALQQRRQSRQPGRFDN